MNAKQTPLVDILRLHAEDLYSDYGHNKSADEIERLRSNALALEEEKNDYMDGVGDVLGQDHDGETLWAAAQRVMSECDRLRAELAECKEMLDEASGYVREDVRRMGDEWSGYIIDAAIDSAVALLDRIDAARKGEGE